MISQELVDYIKKSREAGVEDGSTRRNLLGSGYSVQDIEEAMSGLGVEKSVLENMQNQAPAYPGRLSNESVVKPASVLGRIVKIFVIILVILAGIIGGYWALGNYFPQYAKYVQPYLGSVLDPVIETINSVTGIMNTPIPSPTVTPTPVPAESPQVIDSDGDGLSDVEEAKYGTDPHKADTDGDGYPDGEEVKNGYNPLGPGRLNPSPTP